MQNKVEICGMDTKNLKILSEKEKNKLLLKVKEGNLEAREKLISGNLRLVLSIIQKFVNRGEFLDDLFQIGCIGLIKSIDNFDISQNTRFSTYAVPMIIGEIRRYLRDNNSIRVSRSLRDTAYKALQVKEKYISEHNKEPTIEEISQEMLTTKEIIAVALESVWEPLSLDEPLFTDGSSAGDGTCFMDKIGDCNDDSVWVGEISIKQAINRLNVREKRILYLRFFKGETQTEVAKKLDISQAQISRLEKNIIKKIKDLKNVY
ncbi:MAG: RNA polymerase sporulation sigma factor SigG [Candidatus Improbicoccus devescovinae]|nr:MAG: RNA polymerase sporulation sigma factor SigG [Candidatus Improbicoccus devescovinae]